MTEMKANTHGFRMSPSGKFEYLEMAGSLGSELDFAVIHAHNPFETRFRLGKVLLESGRNVERNGKNQHSVSGSKMGIKLH